MKRTIDSMRRWILICAIAGVVGPALAQDRAKTSVAALSILGDHMTIVNYVPVTGSSLDRSDRQVIQLDGEWDRVTLQSLQRAVAIARPDVNLVFLSLSRQAIEAMRPSSPGETIDALLIADSIAARMREQQIQHLLLVAPHGAPAALKLERFSVGGSNTRLEGLGFYIDRLLRVRRTDTAESAFGFLAPYAYFRVSLIDLSARKLLAEGVTTASTTYSAARSKDADPWNTLTAEQKVKVLMGMIRTEVERVVPEVLAALPTARP